MTSEGLVEFAAKRMECEDPDQRVCLERMTEAEIRVNTAFAHPNIVRRRATQKQTSSTLEFCVR